MAALEFKFSSDQQHQLEAIEATCDLFRGQQFIGSVFSADSGRKGQTAIGELMVGHGNELRVAPGQLLDNLHAVQEEGCLPATDVLTDGRLRDFTVEMETGTGKTYVYIRSIYELNRRYGITKFVIVVPSVAIREGVLKSLQTTRRHFETLYDRTPLDYFVYDSKDMGPVGNFATSSSIQVMVINIDAFNKGLEKDGTAKEGNLFHRPSEKLTGGFSPRELVSACKPVVIIDEPQSVDNTKQAKAAIIERQTGRKVSGKTIAREERLARRIAEDLSPEWAAEADRGNLSAEAVRSLAGMPKERQAEMHAAMEPWRRTKRELSDYVRSESKTQVGPDGRIAKAARLVADFLESPPESPSAADLSLLREMALMTAPYADAGSDVRKRRRRASGPKSSK